MTDPVTDDPHPTHLVPGYETDLDAVGTNRTVVPALLDERPWQEVHGLTAEQATDLIAQHG